MSRILALLLLLVVFQSTVSADWHPVVRDMRGSSWWTGGQTWQIDTQSDGDVIVANRYGLYILNAQHKPLADDLPDGAWRAITPNNHSEVRSSQRIKSRIYVGGINEFGYIEPDANGAMTYKCLSDTLPPEIKFLGNVWNIHEVDGIIYYQGDGRIVRYVNNNCNEVECGGKVDCSAIIHSVLYVATEEQGVQMLIGNTFMPVQGAEKLKGKRIKGIHQLYKEWTLFVTAFDGLYLSNGTEIRKIETEADHLLSTSEVFCSAVSVSRDEPSDGRIALGTVGSGIIEIDFPFNEPLYNNGVRYINESNGLANNTVLSLSYDDAGNIWAGLDNGLDYICVGGPIKRFQSKTGSIGTGYSVIDRPDGMYMGTNRGLFYCSPDGADPRMIPGTSGQVWSLCNPEGTDQILCCHDRGLFLVDGMRLNRIERLDGVWICVNIPGDTTNLVCGVYDGLYLLSRTPGSNPSWRVKGRIDGMNDSCRRLAVQRQRNGQIVVWTINNGVLNALALSQDLLSVTSSKNYEIADKSVKLNDVAIVDGVVYVATSDGIYTYDPNFSRLEPNELVNASLNGRRSYVRLTLQNGCLVALSGAELCIVNGRLKNTTVIPMPQSLVPMVYEFEDIYLSKDNPLAIIPNQEGFVMVEIPRGDNSDVARPEFSSINGTRASLISSVSLLYPSSGEQYNTSYFFSNLRGGESPELVLPYGAQSVRFYYNTTTTNTGDVRMFASALVPSDASEAQMHAMMTDYEHIRFKEYTNLREGQYTFYMRMRTMDGRWYWDSAQVTVLPPWYRTTLAYILYVVGAIIIFFLLLVYDKHRIALRQSQAVLESEAKFEKVKEGYEVRQTENLQKIDELQREALEQELRHKSQELTNAMINFARKNEILTNIKDDITRVMRMLDKPATASVRRELQLISNSIEGNINSDEVLKKVEEQFDLVNNNFLNKLTKHHPDLSQNEKMMCSYLRMGLTTKEIAPLLNISVRGVETIRYRLRKKLGIEDQGLVEWLNVVADQEQ